MMLESLLRSFENMLPHEVLWAALGITFLAGIVASGVCPCTLPLSAAVAGVIGNAESQKREYGFAMAAAFFAGIVVNLTVLGALAGQLGSILTESFGRYWSLAMVILSLGAAIIAFRGPHLNVEKLTALRRPGLVGSFGYGFIFSLGTSAAPLLVLLAIATGRGSTLYGIILSFAFGVGRGFPFLLVGLFARSLVRFARISLWRRTIQFISGCALLLVSLYYAQVFVTLL